MKKTRKFFSKNKKGLTLLEILVTIGVLIIVIAATVYIFDPFDFLGQARDFRRVSDMTSLDLAVASAQAEGLPLGATSTLYVSLPDTSPTCANLGLPPIPVPGWTYHCVTQDNLRKNDGNGWVPINFQNISGAKPLDVLPIDPQNTITTKYYVYAARNNNYEVDANLESAKYIEKNGFDDGGFVGNKFEKGSDLAIIPKSNHQLILAGTWSTLIAKSDGSVWGWGANSNGQLGNGTNLSQSTPAVNAQGLNNIISFDGGLHSFALKSDGTVWTWGNNSFGQLGDNSNVEKWSPAKVQNITGVTAVAGSNYHSLAVKSDGTVWAWGRNGSGQLGDNSTTDRWVPTKVQNLQYITSVKSGTAHSLALKYNGTVWAWGDNSVGQLGTGAVGGGNQLTPVQVKGLDKVIGIYAGDMFSLAVKSDGTVWAWGSNSNGQLGNGVVGGDSGSPTQVQGVSNIISIEGGSRHGLALKSDGTVWAWGFNIYGSIGNGVSGAPVAPAIQVPGVSGVVGLSGALHSLALKSDGTLWGWGHNFQYQLGLLPNSHRLSPVQLDFNY